MKRRKPLIDKHFSHSGSDNMYYVSFPSSQALSFIAMINEVDRCKLLTRMRDDSEQGRVSRGGGVSLKGLGLGSPPHQRRAESVFKLT